MGLVPNSLDMLADSIVYGLSLFAVGGTLIAEKNGLPGFRLFQITLVSHWFSGGAETFCGAENLPDFSTMIFVSVFGSYCKQHLPLFAAAIKKQGRGSYKSKYDFTSNDVIINLGVIAAGFWSPGWTRTGLI